MPDCQPCKERGRITPGERLVGGEWMCEWCFAGFEGPDDPHIHNRNCKLNRPTTGTRNDVGAVHEPPMEDPMPVKKEIDLKAFKADYEAGMPNKDLARKYGIGSTGASYWARKAGSTIRRGRGPSGNGSKAGSRPLRKLQPKAAHSNGISTWSGVIEDLARQRDKLQAAIDALSVLAAD